MIYLDHAATSFHKPKEVAEAVYQALLGTGNSGRGVHGASLDASRLIHQTREKVSSLFGVGNAARVVFTANATASLNMAIQGLLEPSDHCVTTVLEHNSVLRPLNLLAQKGLRITQVQCDTQGCMTMQAFQEAIQPDTKAMIITHASNVLGNVLPIKALGELCKKTGIYLIVDASQTAGLLPIHMGTMGIDILCCSGHKSLLGPQGVGLLCLGEKVNLRPLMAGGTGMDSFSKDMTLPLPMCLEAGTLNTHGIAGLYAALKYIEHYGQGMIYQESMAYANHFLEGVRQLKHIKLYGAIDTVERTPVVALNLGNTDAGDVADELYQHFGIAVRAGAHCAPDVHRTMGTVAQGMVRFSFSHMNTLEEVNKAIEALRQLEEEEDAT